MAIHQPTKQPNIPLSFPLGEGLGVRSVVGLAWSICGDAKLPSFNLEIIVLITTSLTH